MVLANGTILSETTAIARYLDATFEGRKIMGATPKEQALDTMWDSRIWVQILYRITTMLHVMHQGLGPKLELTVNKPWGEHCRKEALGHASLVDRYLSDGREWLLGGKDPTFADMTLCTAVAFSKFPVNATPLKAAYAGHDSGVEELDNPT